MKSNAYKGKTKMTGKKNSNSTKKASSAKKPRAPATSANAAAQGTATAPTQPDFKSWTIRSLSDVATVEAVHLQKVLYFLNHTLRKCYLLQETLVSMTYSEVGGGRIEIETIKNIHDEVNLPADTDPLS